MDVIDKSDLVGRRLGMVKMVCLEIIFSSSVLCGCENGKTNLSRSEQEPCKMALQTHLQFQAEQKSRQGSSLKDLREEVGEESELSTSPL